ncbi:hypothetical protein ACTD5D_17285 [Nocardia takedensis]|uniref:hypothetical protein n=1 Tax=Nocardia takedensis TaxID=259390 RepID=UPI003F76DC51
MSKQALPATRKGKPVEFSATDDAPPPAAATFGQQPGYAGHPSVLWQSGYVARPSVLWQPG